MSDPSVPDVSLASEIFWTQIRRDARGDENVGHVSDLKECNMAVWLRRNGFEKQPLSARTARMFELGHEAERTEVLAIGEGLKAEGWSLEHGVLYWVGLADLERTGPAADLAIEQHDEATGLIGGRLPTLYRGCLNACDHNDGAHDHLTGICRATGCACPAYRPKTALLDTVLVGHGDITLTKAWASVVVDVKSKGFVKKDDAANPRWDYILQTRTYGFAQGAKWFGVLQIDRGSASTTHQYFLTREPAELAKIAQLVRDRLLNTRAGAPQPALFNLHEGKRLEAQPPSAWSCKKGRDGDAYCPYALCRNHPDYAPGGLDLAE